MSYKRGDFVHTSYNDVGRTYNEIGVVLKVHRDQGSKPVYFIRVASGESNWFTLENLAPLGDCDSGCPERYERGAPPPRCPADQLGKVYEKV